MATTVSFDTEKIEEAISKAAPLQSSFDARQAAASDAASLPSPEESKRIFRTIRQGKSTNTLTKLRATEGKGLSIDSITGDATIKRGNFVLTIPNYAQLAGLKTSTYQLLDAITIALTESGAKSPTVVLPLGEYMQRRGLKDRKEAKRKAIEDMKVLSSAKISWEEKRGRKSETYSFISLADSGHVKRNGDIVFKFGDTFFNILLSYPTMPYPPQLQTINAKPYPNSYQLLRCITEHKNMNYGKKNENIISVRTLLDRCPYIPSYDEVMRSNRHIDDRIIAPFERDMTALAPTLSWHYCHRNNEPLTDNELENMDYTVFEGLNVYVEWVYYPDEIQQRKLERRADEIEKAETKKKRARKKPATE